MRWQLGGGSNNIEDRRGLGPASVGGGIGAIVLALAGYFFFGDPQALSGLAPLVGGQATEQQQGVQGRPDDEAGRFVSQIVGSADEVWEALLQAQGTRYRPARVVLYTQATGTGCGLGQSAMGPFYCPPDQTVYLDLDFFQELATRFEAAGDFAPAYVIAHEIGHHVQTLTGQTERANRLGRQGAESGSVRLELQADCYAGIWANRSNRARQWLEAGDIDEALTAAAAVGDDRLQRQAQGRVVPDSFTHGTSQQRRRWFDRGFQTGDPAACDSFATDRL